MKPICSIIDCDRIIVARGFCDMHYRRWRRNGDPNVVKKLAKRTHYPPCSIKGCNSPAITRGWCQKHYIRWHTYGDPLFTKYPALDNPEQAFWDRVDKSDDPNVCWPWTGRAKHNFGYGILFFRGKNEGAHRVAYILTHGEIPQGMHICHKCDNPPCCNPNHLEAGYPKRNIKDIYDRGRENRNRAKGQENGQSKLTEKQVKEIRRLFASGVNRMDISRRYAVNWTTIDRIIKNQTWRHI